MRDLSQFRTRNDALNAAKTALEAFARDLSDDKEDRIVNALRMLRRLEALERWRSVQIPHQH